MKYLKRFNESSELEENKWEGLPPEDKEKIDSMTHRWQIFGGMVVQIINYFKEYLVNICNIDYLNISGVSTQD